MPHVLVNGRTGLSAVPQLSTIKINVQQHQKCETCSEVVEGPKWVIMVVLLSSFSYINPLGVKFIAIALGWDASQYTGVHLHFRYHEAT